MDVDRIPAGLVPAGGSLNFTEDTIPDALQREHALAVGRWGVLHVLEGRMVFVDLVTEQERILEAPDLNIIHPGAPHKVLLDGPVKCRIDFFREASEESGTRTPGEFAGQAVRMSLERCEVAGDFGEVFYHKFLNASPEIPQLFSGTDFHRQRQLLHDSVRNMVSEYVSDPDLRNELDQLGRLHGREGRNIPPRLYELWLDSVCDTVQALDPEWTEALEREWRVRLRPGMQIIMAGY